MKRGVWLVVAGLAALVAVAQQGCSSSSSTSGPGRDGGSPGDGSVGDAGDAGSGEGDGNVGADAGGTDAGTADAQEMGDGSCSVAGMFFSQSAVRAACAGQHCCGLLTACLGSPECISYFRCTAICYMGASPGTSALTMCVDQCSSDSGTTGAVDFSNAAQCVVGSCGDLFAVDAGTD